MPLGLESEYINVFGGDDGPTHIEIAFSRQDFCAALTNDFINSGTLEVAITGSLTTGQYFYGRDTIRIKDQH